MKKEQVYYLSNPDEMSRKHLIGKGHGYLWVQVNGWRYQSVATGKECMFYYSELTPLEQDDDDLC
jgi:hypothetical protein